MEEKIKSIEGRKNFSKKSVISFFISLIPVLIFMLCLDTITKNPVSIFAIGIFLFYVILVCVLVTLVLAIIDLIKKNGKKHFSIIALAICGTYIILLLVILLYALLKNIDNSFM